MATSVKVPKEVMELFYEAEACRSLAEAHSGWLPSLKALYYRQKAVKAEMLGWRALRSVHPVVASDEWTVDLISGVATKHEDPNASKKTRAPRKPKTPGVPATAAPAAKQGEVK